MRTSLENYDWPGNVRELYNVVMRRMALGELAEAPHAKPSEPDPAAADALEAVLMRDLPFPHARDEIVAEFERRYVERLLARYDGNVARAAAASGIARRYFQIIRKRQSTGEARPA